MARVPCWLLLQINSMSPVLSMPVKLVLTRELLLCCTGVSFTYPGATKPQLTDVNIMCRLSSRVAVLGVNGEWGPAALKI